MKSEPVIASGMALVRDLSAENTEKKDAIAVVNGLEELVDTSDYEEVQLHEESVDLHAVVDSCREIMENRAVEAGLSFETPDLAAFDPPRVRASERHLRQIFINLIGNAVKYNRPGGRVVLTFPIDREYRETADPEAPAELDLTGKRILAAEAMRPPSPSLP